VKEIAYCCDDTGHICHFKELFSGQKLLNNYCYYVKSLSFLTCNLIRLPIVPASLRQGKKLSPDPYNVAPPPPLLRTHSFPLLGYSLSSSALLARSRSSPSCNKRFNMHITIYHAYSHTRIVVIIIVIIYNCFFNFILLCGITA